MAKKKTAAATDVINRPKKAKRAAKPVNLWEYRENLLANYLKFEGSQPKNADELVSILAFAQANGIKDFDLESDSSCVLRFNTPKLSGSINIRYPVTRGELVALLTGLGLPVPKPDAG